MVGNVASVILNHVINLTDIVEVCIFTQHFAIPSGRVSFNGLFYFLLFVLEGFVLSQY